MLTCTRHDVPHADRSIRTAAYDELIGHFTTPDAAIVPYQGLFALQEEREGMS